MDIIGHRGARGLVLENTLDSFRRAVGLGVDMVELDIHRLCRRHIHRPAGHRPAVSKPTPQPDRYGRRGRR